MPLTNPTAGDVHVNVPLTNYAQKYLQNADNFIAGRAFPNAPVAKQSDKYYVFDKGDFYRDEAAIRADGTESVGSGFNLSTDTYFADVRAFHKDVTDRQRANQDAAVQLDNSATQYVMHKLLISRERVFATEAFGTSIWGTDFDVSLSGAALWNAANSTPIEEIRDGKRTVHSNTGFNPNKAIIGRGTYDALLDNDDILGRINGGATTALPAMVQRQRLAEILELDEILVMNGVYNSAEEGATDSMSLIGNDGMLLYYAPSTLGLNEPTAGAQFSWTGYMGATQNGMRIKRFRMDALESDRIEGDMAFDFKVTGADLGYFFHSTLS